MTEISEKNPMPDYVATEVLPKLIKKTESIDLNVRHGAILAIGEAIFALSQIKLDDGKSADGMISRSAMASVRSLVGGLRARQQFRGLGGELMRQAVCVCVARLARAAAPYHGDQTIDEWLNLIEECISHEVQVIRERAIEALPLVINEYLRNDDLKYGEVTAKQKRMQLMEKYCEQLSNTGVNGLYLRMGYARAVGSLPEFILTENLQLVVESLIDCSKVTEPTQKWAEARRDAVLGLTEVCRTLGVSGPLRALAPRVAGALLACLGEYTVDMRGDIGAWVREAAITGLLSICRQCTVEAPELLPPELVKDVMCGIAQQAVEKIDRTRAHAGRIFTSLIYNDPEIKNIPHHDALKRIFPSDEVELKPASKEGKEGKEAGSEPRASENSNVVLWLFPGHTMPRFVQLLRFPAYRYSIVKGLVVSAGELTESLVKHTTQSLFSYLNTLHEDKDTLKSICDTIIQVFADNLQVKRITGPMFNFLDRLLSSAVVSHISHEMLPYNGPGFKRDLLQARILNSLKSLVCTDFHPQRVLSNEGKGSISPILEDPDSTFAMDVLKYLQLELRAGKNVYKLLDSINVLCQLIQVGGDVSARALAQLCVRLCCADRYVRRCGAARLFEALTLYGDVCGVPSETLDRVMSILADTDWEKDVNELRPIRNEICDLMNIKRPVMKQKAP